MQSLPTITKTVLILCLIFAPACFAWDGYDYDNSASVEIDKGNLVRSGNDIEIFDYDDSSYHDVTVEDINRLGSEVEVEVYDHDTEQGRTLTMEDN